MVIVLSALVVLTLVGGFCLFAHLVDRVNNIILYGTSYRW